MTVIPSHAGFIPFRAWKTWFTVFGDLNSGQIPLVALHGGPAAGCRSLEDTLRHLWPTASVPVVVYDQVGCGRSTHLHHLPQETFTIEFFLDELQNLLAHLGIKNYNLLGHSWGGMLGLEHAVRQPIGLNKFVIEGGPASGELCVQQQNICYRSLGEKYYQAVAQHDRDGIETEDYKKASQLFRERFHCRTDPVPQCVIDVGKTVMEAHDVCDALWGTIKDLECTGSLKTWSIIPRLPLIKNKILVITGDHDFCGGVALEPYLNGKIDARMVTFVNSGHLIHIDGGKGYISTVARFLKE